MFSIWAYWRIAFVAIAVPLFFLFVDIHLEVWWPIPFVLGVGYIFGKYTCDIKARKKGLWLTLGAFTFLNFLHSLIDGIGLIGIGDLWSSVGAIAGHEIIRQPTLFVIAWAMLSPFSVDNMWTKVLVSVSAVTGVWIVGLTVGLLGGEQIAEFEWMHDFLGYSIFLFLGDILHHVMDDVLRIRRK